MSFNCLTANSSISKIKIPSSSALTQTFASSETGHLYHSSSSSWAAYGLWGRISFSLGWVHLCRFLDCLAASQSITECCGFGVVGVRLAADRESTSSSWYRASLRVSWPDDIFLFSFRLTATLLLFLGRSKRSSSSQDIPRPFFFIKPKCLLPCS
jgi:hypothetical protein